MPKRTPIDDDPSPKSSNTGLLIAGIVGGGLALLLCCGGVGVGVFFAIRGAANPAGPIGLVAPDVIGRWENNDLAQIIVDLRANGTGTIEVPAAKTTIRITHQLQGNELTLTEAPGQPLGPGELDAVDRLRRTRVTRIGDTLRMEALAGPGQGQAMQLKKIG
jgi:hypothetical protein